MKIVETTSRQFREKQKDFFDLADTGKKVVIKRGSKQAYLLTPITQDDIYFTDEMIQRIKEAEEEVKQGKGVSIKSEKELEDFFNRL